MPCTIQPHSRSLCESVCQINFIKHTEEKKVKRKKCIQNKKREEKPTMGNKNDKRKENVEENGSDINGE